MTKHLVAVCLSLTMACGVGLEPEDDAPVESRSDAVFNPPSPPPSNEPVPTQCATTNRCFGAVGMQCNGSIIINGIAFVGCNGNTCFVNAGSILHDQCCFSTPTGRWCGGPASAFNAGCVTSWDRATERWSTGLTWKRTVNTCEGDADGIVSLAKYCAPAGSVIRAADAAFCCGGAASSRVFAQVADRGLADAQGVSPLVRGDPLIVCTAAPAPPPPPPSTGTIVEKSCNPNIGCGPGAVCTARFVKGVYGHYCMLY